MEEYTYAGYTLFMLDTGRFYGSKHIVGYILYCEDEGVIFKGDDYYPSPMFEDSVGAESASTLLAILTLQEGDIDDEWFEDYTDKQIKFRDGNAEVLGWNWVEKIYPGFHDAGM